jgi:hypothetical protein
MTPVGCPGPESGQLAHGFSEGFDGVQDLAVGEIRGWTQPKGFTAEVGRDASLLQAAMELAGP